MRFCPVFTPSPAKIAPAAGTHLPKGTVPLHPAGRAAHLRAAQVIRQHGVISHLAKSTHTVLYIITPIRVRRRVPSPTHPLCLGVVRAVKLSATYYLDIHDSN